MNPTESRMQYTVHVSSDELIYMQDMADKAVRDSADRVEVAAAKLNELRKQHADAVDLSRRLRDASPRMNW